MANPKRFQKRHLFFTILSFCLISLFQNCGGGFSSGSSQDLSSTQAAAVASLRITQQPLSASVTQGMSVSFSVVATGADLTYQWYKNDVVISGATNPILVLSNVLSADAASYYVLVQNKDGNISSDHVSLTVSSGSLSAPTNVQIVLQGQDKQGQSNYDSNMNAVMPANVNHLTIAWKSVSGATSYNIYRSVNQGAYTLYANVPSSTAAAAYSSYVSNSGSYDHQTNVDSAYQDTAATNCVSVPNSKIVSYTTPDFGASKGYTYKVSAVSSGGEGALSADSIAVYFAGGVRVMNADRFNGTINYVDTTAPVASPLGNTTNAKWTATAWNPTDGGDAFINPYAGSGSVGFNFNVKGFNYLVLNVLVSQSGSSFDMDPELEGDSRLLTVSPNSSKYGTLVPNKWVTLKIPLADVMTNQLGSAYIGRQYYEFYKITLASSITGTYWVEWYFSVK